MNKIYKVVWNKARHCYMVGSEFISSHSTGSMSKRGSKSLAAALAVCAVCSMGNVFAADALSGKETQNNQYVAYKSKNLGPFHPTGYHYEKYGENGYYVCDGYTLTIDENGGQYTPLCNELDTSKTPMKTRADVTWIGKEGETKPEDILESSSSIISASGTVTNLGESLHEITPGSFVGVSYSGGTVVPGTFDYIINDSSWAGHVGKYNDRITYQDGWANVIASDSEDNNMPKGFMTTDNSNGRFEWDDKRKTYTYDGKAVDYSNVYVIGGKIGVFTNYGGTEVYKGTVYGRNNEILKTAKSKKDGNLYSFWAAAVTDPSATMDSYRIETYKTDLAILHRDDVSLHNADIKEVQMTTTNDSATFTMVHNGTDEDGNNIPVDGAAITIANGGGTEGKDTWISVGNTDTNAKTFNTGSKVEAITSTGKTTNDTTPTDITGIKINGIDYTIKDPFVHIYNGGNLTNGSYTSGTQIASDMTISNLQFDFGDGLKASEVTSENGKRVLVTLDKDALKDDPAFKGDKGEKGDKGDTGAPGKDGKDGKDGGVGTVVGDEMNITVTNTETDPTKPGNYKVSLNKEITVDKVTAGNTTISSEGLTIAGGPSITKSGIDAGGKKVTHVAAGEVSANSTDAVNGSQLYATNQAVINNAENISTLNRSLSNLDNRVNKVGAGAAALAALHPLDFDPDAKWDFAAGYGNYRGTNAAAVGAYYRPNEDTMFSVGGTFGNGENMVNAGVSFKIGAGSSHVSTSRVAMAKEIKELRSELEAMKSAMLDANAGKKMDTSKLQLFPDVPKNHWAYEYVAQLAGNGMIEGYPDGNFAGDRPMTRYEFAAVLYRAMTKGAVLSDKILNEFSHELEYFTVDTIAKDKDGNPTIQRVRTVKG